MIRLKAVAGDDRALRDAYGRFPSGVTALCGLGDGVPIGMTASAFVPVSLNPPLVSVCIIVASRTWEQLRTLKRQGISFLGEAHDATARQLAAKTGDRFAGIGWDATADGAVFVEGAAAWLECSVEKEIPAGDHQIVLFRIHQLTADPKVRPLVFHGSKFRQLASG